MQPVSTPHLHERALMQIARGIRENPDTGGGVQLRRFLWSLYNQHHLVNLWTLVSRLDHEHSVLVKDVMTAALVGTLQESDIKRALVAAGEMDRWDTTQPSDETRNRLDEVRGTLESMVRTQPPGPAHTDLVFLLNRFSEVTREWAETSRQTSAS